MCAHTEAFAHTDACASEQTHTDTLTHSSVYGLIESLQPNL